ncbi:hypothetical protein [Actinoplanes sp. NPDC089786]|uniref:hypothetical protein n=1 Tax=Actinoplanes sp. NPDC089786 TaxID=3155185 RepID=UPI00343E0B96
MLRPGLIAVALAAALCGALGSPEPAADGRDEAPVGPATPINIRATSGGGTDLSDDEIAEIIKQANRPPTSAEAEAAIDRTRKNSAPSHYYPGDAPDPNQEPPPLAGNGP